MSLESMVETLREVRFEQFGVRGAGVCCTFCHAAQHFICVGIKSLPSG